MIPVAIVSMTQLNRGVFMPAAQQITGENHVTDVDAHPGLSSLVDDRAILRNFSSMNIDLSTAIIHIGVLVAGFREDVEDFLIYTRTMPYCPTDKATRGTWAAVVSGSLDQWKTAIVDGCNSGYGPVRAAYNELYKQFISLGLSFLFQEYRPIERTGQFLLEQK